MDLKSHTTIKQVLKQPLLLNAYRNYLTVKKKIYLNTAKSEYNQKVFCIGFQKTGTTTLGRSLKILGFNHSSFDRTLFEEYYLKNRNIDKIIYYTSKFESFDDMPWSKIDMIPILDKTFRGSKYVYLKRDENSWKSSMYNWYYKKFGIYPDVESRLREYKEHQEFVMKYFKNRIGKDLIILDIEDKKGFTKLANFLGKKAPSDFFPHYNKTKLIPNYNKSE